MNHEKSWFWEQVLKILRNESSENNGEDTQILYLLRRSPKGDIQKCQTPIKMKHLIQIMFLSEYRNAMLILPAEAWIISVLSSVTKLGKSRLITQNMQ